MEEANNKVPEVKQRVTYKRNHKDTVVKVTMLILLVLLFISNTIFMSLAFFTDSATSKPATSILTFGTVKVNAECFKGDVKQDPIVLDEQLAPGSEIVRKLTIENTGNVQIYVRIKGVFNFVSDSLDDSFIEFNIASAQANPVAGTSVVTYNNDDYFYYNMPLAAKQKIEIECQFEVDEGFGHAMDGNVYSNAAYNIQVLIEACQAANTGIGSGATFNPQNWKN